MNDKSLWRFNDGYARRGGDVSCIFIASRDEVEKVIGRRCYFGEILGKHSDVSVDLKREMFEEIMTANDGGQVLAELTKRLGGTWSGHNPVERIAERDEEESE